MTTDRGANERMQIEEVFGLTGGELETTPWEPIAQDGQRELTFKFTYWYTGVPSYAQELDDYDHETLTVVRDELFGQVPETVTDETGTWDLVARFSSSGECECPGRVNDGELANQFPIPCSYCDAGEDDEHGYIYIGDGWAEIVYRKRSVVSQSDDDERCETCHHGLMWDDVERMHYCPNTWSHG